MPFGPYKDFDACVKANQDKSSPEGYCASIEKKITGEWPGVKKAEGVKSKPWAFGNPNPEGKSAPKEEGVASKPWAFEGKNRASIRREKHQAREAESLRQLHEQREALKPGTIKKAMDFVMKAVSIDTSSYEGSHGRHPRIGPYVGARMHQTSQSPWMVEIGGKQHEFRGTYKDAMTQAKTKAREMGSGSVKVLP